MGNLVRIYAPPEATKHPHVRVDACVVVIEDDQLQTSILVMPQAAQPAQERTDWKLEAILAAILVQACQKHDAAASLVLGQRGNQPSEVRS